MLFVEKLFLWFLLYSFCGWVYESILVSILERRPVNRGFLNGPLCPIYGVGAVGAVVVLGQVHNPLVVFLFSMVGASILEYVTSWVMEALFHAEHPQPDEELRNAQRPAGGTTPTTNSILTGASACWGRSCSAWAACSSRR